jgi:selenocysteine-specific elongation factor
MIIGTAGHIDHGKTALVKALTGVDADRLKEEKARGITIDLGYAYQPLPSGDVLGFIDVPGHEKLVHNMLAGATGIDFVLLVIAADDGPMPQTREHLAILNLLGLTQGAVALTKIDRVTPERIAAAQQEIHSLLRGTRLEGCPIFPVSAIKGDGIDALVSHLRGAADATPSCSPEGHFRLAIDRVFTLTGTGTVVTGTVFSGEVHVEDKVMLSPAGIEARVRGIHAQNQPAERGRAGQRCALNLAGSQLRREDIHRGDWVLSNPAQAPVQRLDARLQLLRSETKNLSHWAPVHFHLGTSDVTARVALLEGETLEPGASMLAQIVTDRPICAVHGDRFVLRNQSATWTVGGGVVLDVFPPARNRRRRERIAVLRSLETEEASRALAASLERSGEGVDLRQFARNWNLRNDELDTLRDQVPMRRVDSSTEAWGFAEPHWEALKQTILERLAAMHQQDGDELGPDRDRLRRVALPTVEREVFTALLGELLTARKITKSGPWLQLPEHRVRLSDDEQRLWLKVRPLIQQAAFQPPRVRDVARALALEETAIRSLLKHVTRTGETYRVAYDHYFTRDAIDRLAGIVHELSDEHGSAGAAAFRDRIGTGRKLAIQILEFFDRVGYTRRVGDEHRLRAAPWGQA